MLDVTVVKARLEGMTGKKVRMVDVIQVVQKDPTLADRITLAATNEGMKLMDKLMQSSTGCCGDCDECITNCQKEA